MGCVVLFLARRLFLFCAVAPGGTAPVVIPLAVATAKRAAAIVRPLFPQASIREDARANALIVLAPPADFQSMTTVVQGIDVRDPSTAVTEALPLRVIRAGSARTTSGSRFRKRGSASWANASCWTVNSASSMVLALHSGPRKN
ncbi:MAG: hypothetical protein M3O50_10555 [Myxococcota bacterium]|nr:hypothetical protein [Myxococcota bacterium]